MQHLDRLKDFYSFIDLRHDGCPVWFSAAVPAARAILQWPGFPQAALPATGRVAPVAG